MAINKKLISFATQAQFDVKLNAGDIDNRSIVFIEDKKRIWTHGVYFDTSWNYMGDKPSTFNPSAHTLGSHSDVTLASLANGNILRYNGSKWVNNTLAQAGIATQSDIDTAIDNLEIGGRNLVLNSKDFQIGYSGSGISRSITEEGYLQVVAEVGNGNYVSTFLKAGYGTLLNNGFLKQGDLITVSMEVKSPNSTGVPTLYLKAGYGYNQFKGTLSDKFSKISFTTTWREANNLNLHLGFSGLVGTYIFKNIKIEKGTKATDWTPAPEDQVSDWSETNTSSYSYIKNKPSWIGASKPTYAFSEITGTASVAQIPNLDAGKITSGIFNIARIPTGTTSTTVALGNHTHAYLPLSGGKLTGDLEIFAGNTDKFIKFAYNTTDAYAWRIGYLGTGAGNENRLVFQSAKTSGASYVDALSFGLDDLVGKFAVTPTVGNTKVSLEGHNHTLKLIAGTSTATVDSTVDVADPYIRLFSDNVHQGNIRIVGGTNVGAVSKAGTITLTATDTTYTAGSNITINSNNVIAGNYPSLTKALLDAGSATTQSVATPQVLASWLDGKIESKVDKSDWSDSYNIPSSLFLNRTSWIRIGKFTSSYKANPTILNFRASSGNGGYGGSCIISLSGNNTTGKDIFVSVLNQTNATTFRKIRVIRKESNWYGDAYIDVELRSGSSGVSVSYQESLPKGGIEFTTPIELGADYLPSGYVEDVYELDKAYFEDIATQGVYKKGSSNSYLLLGGGGHKAISDFNASLVTSTTTSGTTNVATSNTNTYLNIVQGGASIGSSTRITGSGSVTVSSDVNGVLTINGVNTNTEYLTNTLAHLNTGTDTVGKLQTAKNLHDWLSGKNYATESYVDGIEIGGRNILLDSKNIKITGSDGGGGIIKTVNNYNLIRVEAIGDKSSTQNFYNTSFAYCWKNQGEIFYQIHKGEEFVLSMDIKYSGSSRVRIAFDTRNPNNAYYARTEYINDTNGEWVRVYAVKKESGRGINKESLLVGWFDSVKKGDFIEIRNIKLEKGNKATDWTPAPEDQVSDWNESNATSFSFIKNKPTQLSQFTDNIGVGSHIANKSNPHAVTTAQIGALPLTGGTLSGGLNILSTSQPSLKIMYDADRFLEIGHSSIQNNSSQNNPLSIGSKSSGDGMYFSTGIGTSYKEQMRINSIGNVGIGTTNPLYKLDVSGTGRFTGNVTAPSFIGALTGNASSSTTANYLSYNWTTDLNAVTNTGVYRQEQPSSGYSYTSTLNMRSNDGRQQLTISRDGSGMKFRGVNSGSGTTGWTAWKEVYHTGNFTPGDYVKKTGDTVTGTIIANNPITEAVIQKTSASGLAVLRMLSTGQSHDKGLGLSLSGELVFGDWSAVGNLSSSWNKLWHSGNLANGTTSQYIRGDGSLATYSDTTYSEITEAQTVSTSSSAVGLITGRRLKYAFDNITAANATNANILNRRGDNRGGFKPSDITSGALITTFSTQGALLSQTNNSDYVDVIGLSTYQDSSAGQVNALAFDKSSHRITHFMGTFGTSSWSSNKTLAYTDGTGASGTWGINITGNASSATNASKIYTSQKADNVNYQIPFVASVTAGNSDLYTDSAANFTYNPSTNAVSASSFNGITGLAGTGSASTASRSDHTHSNYVTDTDLATLLDLINGTIV